MERISRFRAILLLILFITILALFALKLFDLQIIKTNGNTDNIAKYTTVTTVRAARGDILDRNGPLHVGGLLRTDNHLIVPKTQAIRRRKEQRAFHHEAITV